MCDSRVFGIVPINARCMKGPLCSLVCYSALHIRNGGEYPNKHEIKWNLCGLCEMKEKIPRHTMKEPVCVCLHWTCIKNSPLFVSVRVVPQYFGSFIRASSSKRTGHTSNAMVGYVCSHCAHSVLFVCFSRVLWYKWDETIVLSILYVL